MAYLTAAHNLEHRVAGRLSTFTAQFRAAMERRRVYNQTVKELSALNGRELADLGIHRSMIRQIALDAANGH